MIYQRHVLPFEVPYLGNVPKPTRQQRRAIERARKKKERR